MCNKNMRIKNSVRKLVYKLCISFTNKKIRKKFKVLVAFFVNQKIGGQLGFLPPSFFSKLFDQNYEKTIFSTESKERH